MASVAEPGVSRILARFLARVAVVLLLLYLGFCAYLYFDQRHMIYFPEYVRTADGTNLSVPNGNIALKGWLLNPSRAKALLYFGGNGEDLGAERESLARMFPDRAVFLLPYRGYGPNAGAPSEKAIFSDALALYDTAHAGHATIAVAGRSLGTGVASYVASKRRVERLALITPFDKLASAAQARFSFVPVDLLLKDRYESAEYVRGYSGPALVLRAGADQVIPAASTDRLIAAFLSKPRVVNFPDAGHNSISDDPRYAQVLSQFMR